MKRAAMDHAVGTLAAPAIGMMSALALQQHITHAATPKLLAGLAASCGTEGAGELCTLQTVSTTLLAWSFGILVASILLPVCCVAMIRRMASSRRQLAQRFPTMLHVCLVLLVTLLAAQGCLVLLSGYELFVSGVIDSSFVLCFILLLAIGFFSSAIAIVADLPRVLTIEPVQMNGVLVESRSALAARVARVAGRLDTAVPEHIVIGLGPRIFATAAALRLHEIELSSGVTLHLSAPALHIMDEAELDALIARELGALRGEATGFTSHLVPLCAALGAVIVGAGLDRQGAGTVAALARIPSNGFLKVLSHALQRVQREVGLQRELEADRAALELVKVSDLVSALTKSAALELRWGVFRTAYDHYMSRGNTRRNLTVDFLSHLATFADTTDSVTLRTSLLAASLPDIFGGRVSLAELIAAHAIPMQGMVTAVRAQLSQVPQRDALLAVHEERVTALENDYFRVPGQRAVLNTQESLPLELVVV